MHPVTEYLKNHADNYLEETARLIRQYALMVESLVEMILACSPADVLDLGCGPAYIAEKLLSEDSHCRVTCVDVKSQMTAAAIKRLAHFIPSGRARVDEINMLDFAAENGAFDVILSNLVFKFFDYETKEMMLRKIHSWLRNGGVFIWGDFITFKDQLLVKDVRARRKKFALAQGIDKELLRLFLVREGTTDTPLTVEKTLLLAREIFSSAELTWLHDNSAIFLLRK